MATVQAHNQQTRNGSNNTKAKATPAAPKAKPEAPKQTKPALDRLAGRIAKLGRAAEKALGGVRGFQGQGSPAQQESIALLLGKLTTVVEDSKTAGEALATLVASGFKPAKGTKAPKPGLGPDVQVWLRPKRQAEYLGAYGAEALGSLYVEKVVGAQALVRIGHQPSEGQVSRLMGFVSKAHLTTRAPA